ncbi:MAG: YceI family protein [Chloroflexi bacterium]|nr:YceI family protein [Chloroflexota bacterium]
MRNLFAGLLVLLAATACGPFAPAEPTVAPTTAPRAAATSAATASAASTPATARPANTPAASGTTAPSSTTPATTLPADAVRVVFADDSEARYRVREQLAGVSLPSDAIGRTKTISGQIIARTDGTILSDQSKITVDVSTLRSDESRRDNFLRMAVLETGRYPQAVFMPTSAKGLTVPLKDGPIAFQLIGDLTVRNVTKSVTWDVTGEFKNGEARGTATTSFTFAYFNIQKPNVPMVLGVEDTIKLELDLHLKRG